MLKRVLLRMRGETARRVSSSSICTKVGCRMADRPPVRHVRGVPPEFIDEKVYTNEQEIQHDIFLMRLDELPESYGFPEDFDEGWKRKDDNWPVT